MSRAVSELEELLGLEPSGSLVRISGVSSVAQEVEPGDLFVALPGARHHGLDFIETALSLGATAVLTDRPVTLDIPVLIAKDPKSLIGKICNFVMGEVPLTLFAVTGTNGKTSTANYLHQLLVGAGVKALLSSSIGIDQDGELIDSSLTTSELTTLRKLLNRAHQSGAKAAVIEVSAQALVRHRVDGLVFSVSGFTNLSRDHLDDFGDMETYLRAKALLFEPERSKRAVIFEGDQYSTMLGQQLQIPVTTIGTEGQTSFSVKEHALVLNGKYQARLDFQFGELMAKNFALAFVMLCEAGYRIQELSASARSISQVPGRLQLVSQNTPHTYLDYAHTPDGIAKAVGELKSRYPGVTLVFGASGNRDVGKRFEMGQAAVAADLVFLTDQHPRDEDPGAIRAAVAAGLREQDKDFIEVANPETAIVQAISNTPAEHAVLWCGPGHLKYREVAGQKLAFDALKISQMAVDKNA